MGLSAPTGGVSGLLTSLGTPGADGVSFGDRLGLLGASLRDDPEALKDAQGGLLARQQIAQQAPLIKAKLGLLQQYTGGGAPSPASAPPTGPAGATASDPSALGDSGLPVLDSLPSAGASSTVPGSGFARQRSALAGLSALDGKYSDAFNISKPSIKIGPDGRPYDENDPASLADIHPTLNPEHAFDGKTVTNLPGSLAAQAAVTRANAAASEGAKADLDVISVPTKDGGTVSMPRSQYVKLQEMGILAPGVGVGQNTGSRAFAEATGQGAGKAPYTPDDRTDESGAPVYGTLADRLGGGGPRGSGAGGGMRGQSPATKTYQEGNAKAESERFGAIQTAQQAIPNKRAALQQISTLLNGVDGGTLTPNGVEIASTLNSLGIKIDPKLGNKQAAAALSNQMTLAARSTADGGGLPGSVSDSDRRFLQQSVPGLTQSSDGRKQIIAYQGALLDRQERYAKAAADWNDRFGRLSARDSSGKNFDAYWNAYTKSKPLFGAPK